VIRITPLVGFHCRSGQSTTLRRGPTTAFQSAFPIMRASLRAIFRCQCRQSDPFAPVYVTHFGVSANRARIGLRLRTAGSSVDEKRVAATSGTLAVSGHRRTGTPSNTPLKWHKDLQLSRITTCTRLGVHEGLIGRIRLNRKSSTRVDSGRWIMGGPNLPHISRDPRTLGDASGPV